MCCCHRNIHVLTHSFPTRLSSDLPGDGGKIGEAVDRPAADEGTLADMAPELTFGLQGGERLPELGAADSQRLAELTLRRQPAVGRSEEQTSELQSLMRISYAVFCLTQNKNTRTNIIHTHHK